MGKLTGGMKMKIAKVIVDVPLMQTDKPFSYTVPESLVAFLEVGMRVHVPFGVANRLLQGIVVDFSDDSDLTVLSKRDKKMTASLSSQEDV